MPPTLLYHRISNALIPGVTQVAPQLFQKQLSTVKNAGFSTLCLNEAHNNESSSTADGSTFSIVFDDGLNSVCEQAFPIMQQMDFKGVVFIPSGYIGRFNDWDYQFLGHRARHMDKQMLIEVSNAGWQVGSHTVSHRALTSLKQTEIDEELKQSKSDLEDLLGKSVDWVSFPFGRYNRGIVQAAVEAGYKGVCSHVPPTEGVMTGVKFQVARGVYLWDNEAIIKRDIENWEHEQPWQSYQRVVSRLSGGTIIWRKLFPIKDARDKLAK